MNRNQTCNYEITLTSEGEIESAFCGYRPNHAGDHGHWQF